MLRRTEKSERERMEPLATVAFLLKAQDVLLIVGNICLVPPAEDKIFFLPDEAEVRQNL